jgi:hypothetical protein
MVARQCDFRTALKLLAAEAHIQLPVAMTREERQRLAREQVRHKRIGKAAGKAVAVKNDLRLRYRNLIDATERKQREFRARLAELADGSPERWRQKTEGCWNWLATLTPLLREYLAAYSLLNFGSARDQAKFTLRPALRQAMIDRALWEGFVDDHGKRREVLE